MLIDDFSTPGQASNGNRWQVISDRVMGGVSVGGADYEELEGRRALRLRGEVSLENNGGFLQLALDLGDAGGSIDAGAFDGIRVSVLGDGTRYGVHLRSSELSRPWQSYRASVDTASTWETHHLRFSDFKPHRTQRELNPRRLRRIGLIAVGNAGPVDLAISHLSFFSEGFI